MNVKFEETDWGGGDAEGDMHQGDGSSEEDGEAGEDENEDANHHGEDGSELPEADSSMISEPDKEAAGISHSSVFVYLLPLPATIEKKGAKFSACDFKNGFMINKII